MNGMTDAVAVMGAAVATAALRDSLLSDIAVWAENNPYIAYGHYDDTLSDEQIDLMLEDRQAFDESWWDIERNVSDYAEWGEIHEELIAAFADRLVAAYPEELADWSDDNALEWEDLPEDVKQAFWENSCVDASDVLQTCLRNASRSTYFLAIPSDPDSPNEDADEAGAIGLPHSDFEDEENEARQRYLEEKFGIDGWACESCYSHERLKVLGKLDLEEIYEKGKPTTIRIDPHDSVIFHTSWNGSGCLGTPVITKTVTLPATFQRDAERYGVQSVYGFTGDVWKHTLNTIDFQEWE